MAIENGTALVLLALLALGIFLFVSGCAGKHHKHPHHRHHDRGEYTAHATSSMLSTPESAPLSSNSAAMSLNGDNDMGDSPDLFRQYDNTWQGTGFGDCASATDRSERDQGIQRARRGLCGEENPDGYDAMYVGSGC